MNMTYSNVFILIQIIVLLSSCIARDQQHSEWYLPNNNDVKFLTKFPPLQKTDIFHFGRNRMRLQTKRIVRLHMLNKKGVIKMNCVCSSQISIFK